MLDRNTRTQSVAAIDATQVASSSTLISAYMFGPRLLRLLFSSIPPTVFFSCQPTSISPVDLLCFVPRCLLPPTAPFRILQLLARANPLLCASGGAGAGEFPGAPEPCPPADCGPCSGCPHGEGELQVPPSPLAPRWSTRGDELTRHCCPFFGRALVFRLLATLVATDPVVANEVHQTDLPRNMLDTLSQAIGASLALPVRQSQAACIVIESQLGLLQVPCSAISPCLSLLWTFPASPFYPRLACSFPRCPNLMEIAADSIFGGLQALCLAGPACDRSATAQYVFSTGALRCLTGCRALGTQVQPCPLSEGLHPLAPC